MPLINRLKRSSSLAGLLPLSLLLALTLGTGSALASVETYGDTATTSDPDVPPQTQIVTRGEITLHDVIQTHNLLKKEHDLQQAGAQPLTTATAPKLKDSATTRQTAGVAVSGSAASVMMQQGLKSSLQQAGDTGVPSLRPPVVKASTASPTADITATETPMPTNGVAYQPGQGPKALGGLPTATATTADTTVIPLDHLQPASSETVNAAPAPTPDISANTSSSDTSPSAQPTATSEAPAAADADMAAGCEPKVTSWTKSCVDAGYPDNFTGSIRGETRTTCPDQGLHDVWMSNTCTASNGLSDNTPLSAPIPSNQMGDQAVDQSGAFINGGSNQGDAACGAANGLAANARPNGELCMSGVASDISGQGPWRWNCQSTRGISVSCAAPVAEGGVITPQTTTKTMQSTRPTEDGECGAADGAVADHSPSANLCARGVSSRVSGNGPWTWACSGINGGQAVACTATSRVDGVCGAANAAEAEERPASDLCVAGFASAVTGEGPWNWTCSGINGGQAATCSAAPRQDAVCGGASLRGQHSQPQDELCSVGVASHVSGSGPWSWSCAGLHGGSSVSCEARTASNGSCGSANGVAVAEAPRDNLCRDGNATRVTGLGPWNWNCLGIEGGDSASCTAPRAPAIVHDEPAAISTPAAMSTAPEESSATATSSVTHTTHNAPATTPASDMCGGASELAALEAPAADLCKMGNAGAVTGDGPWHWHCNDDAGHAAECSTLSPNEEPATPAAAPVPDVHASQPDATEAFMHPAATQMAAPAVVEDQATCGTATAQGASEAPSDGLCAIGKASKVRGNGPWTWSCAKGKSRTSCQASRLTEGVCGVSNGSVQRNAPSSGLCSSGTPTGLHGSGPWLWSCVGNGGGSSSSCSAEAFSQTRVDGACGAASSAPTAAPPSVNLCDSGAASHVYGEGPWTWTCSGMNGGIATSCSAQRNIPPAPPPPGPAVDGLCGAANGVALGMQPLDNLCVSGTSTAVSGQGPWNWNCLGQNGGMTVSCTAALQPPSPVTGVCGNASGVPTLTSPRSGLCNAGISSAVSGQGPWTWSCSGTNGGGAVGCVAPLAGTGNVGSLPSLVSTPAAGDMTAPNAAPTVSVKSGTLVTPHLSHGALPPLQSGSLPQLTPSRAFDAPPEPSAMPPEPAPSVNLDAPNTEPGLPEGAQPLTPPPVRDTLKPSAANRPVGFDETGKLIPGNHFKLDDDISTIGFAAGQENFDTSVTPTLDRLADVLQANSGVRITLTAYAEVNQSTSPREARRLSLTRALAIRDYLTTKGISSARIDVRALGANLPSGDPNRVDIKAN